MVTLVEGVDPNDLMWGPSLEERIRENFQVDINTKKPLDIQKLSERIGKRPSLLLCAMLRSPKCSKFGAECLIEVLAGIAENQPIGVSYLDYGPNQTRPFNFTLTTEGFLKELFEPINLALEERNHVVADFCFTPEHNVSKKELREFTKTNSSYDLDLKIDMYITISYDCSNKNNEKRKRESESILVGSVIVEFDGPMHLNDEQVRKDKIRDSMVQSNGCTVFRVQKPYKHQGQGTTKLNSDILSATLEGQIQDIKNHFQNKIFATIKTHHLLKSLHEKT